MTEFMEKWWPLLAIFIPAILNALNIKVPVIVPTPKPDPKAPLAFPTTFGKGELIAYILAIVQQWLADGTIKLPFSAACPPNTVALTPEQVMQVLNAKPPAAPTEFPQP